MKITKYEHACLVIEDNGKVLVLDPGAFDKSFDGSIYCDILVVTHEHFDHLNEDKIKSLIKNNPNLKIYTTKHVSEVIKNTANFDSEIVNDGSTIEESGFNLKFYGTKHAFIHDLAPPVCDNFGVLINDKLYYPGDSFELPGIEKVQILAVPTSGPWLKTGDAMQLILDVNPGKVFPSHNALNSQDGNEVQAIYLGKACEKSGSEYFEIKPVETVEV